MSAVFGSSTIAMVNSVLNLKTAQAVIGVDLPAKTLLTNTGQMQNGHIGAAQGQTVTPVSAADQIAADQTPGIKNDASDIKWDRATGKWVAGT